MLQAKYFNVKVYIPDSMGGTYTYFGRYANSADEAMDSVQEDNPDVTVISAYCVDE